MGHGSRVTGRLHVIATPIGNLEDLSARAARLLGEVDLILAEDTRQVRKLLNHLGLSTPTRSLHEHNEAASVPRLLAELQTGKAHALVSDAGTPLLSDPGFHLVRACREHGIQVLAVPGPSSVTAALSVAGLEPYPFTFCGFLPARPGPRRSTLQRMSTLPHTLVIFLSPHRLPAELAACAEVLGGTREAALLSELSKLHERCERGVLEELSDRVARISTRGEHILVVGPPRSQVAASDASPETARLALEKALASGVALAEARRVAARTLGLSRRELYALLNPAPARPGRSEPE